MDHATGPENQRGSLREDAPPIEEVAAKGAEALQERIETALAEEVHEDVEALPDALHAADLADLLTRLEPEDRNRTLAILEPQLQRDPEVLAYLNDEVLEEALTLFEPKQLAKALIELDSDDAFDLIEHLKDNVRDEVLAELPSLERRWAEEALALPEYSAGRLMQREFLAVPIFWTVGKTIDYLRVAENLPDEFYDIFVTDPMYRPRGDIRISQILRSKRSVRLADLVTEELHTVPAAMDQEEVARLFRLYGLTSAPVVDEAGRLIGVITVDDVVAVIDEEAEDDLLKLGGVQEDDLYRDVLETSRARFSWLGVNLFTAIVASGVIAIFEGTIEQLVALAVLMPIVASMGGNAGTQALTVAVRALATKEITDRNARRIVWKEALVGGLNGLLFAGITGGVATAWFGDWVLGLVMGLAMIGTLIVAGLAGTVIPLALNRLRIDPALASGVFLTTVTDVVGFFAFLGLAAWILL